MGRPTDFTQDIADAICEHIASGKSLRNYCEMDGTPGQTTVFRWLAAHEAFREQYARAREAQADAFFDDMLEIADDGRNDFMLKTNADGGSVAVVDHEHIQRSKLRVDARKWMASKLAPKKYGDRTQVALTDANGGPVQFTTVYEQRPPD